MSIPLDGCMEHSLETLKKCAALPPSKPARVRLCSQHQPLLAIDPDHIILDELHLLLRILDVLIRNLILETVRLDIENNQRAGGSLGSHLERLVSTEIVRYPSVCGKRRMLTGNLLVSMTGHP